MSAIQKSPERLVFVTLPDASVETVKDLPSTFTVLHIKEKLELLASIPSSVYKLKKSDGSFMNDKDIVQYGVSFMHGTVLKIDILPTYLSLYWNIKKNQHVEVMSTVSSHVSNKEKKVSFPFFAMYLAAGMGQVTLCRKLTSLGTVKPTDTTHFGRSPLHAAAAHDCLSVTQFLVQKGWRVRAQDQQGCSVLNVASKFGAASCERWMRLWCLSKEGWAKEHKQNVCTKYIPKEAGSNLNYNVMVSANMKELYRVNPESSHLKDNDQPLDLKSTQVSIIPRRESLDKQLGLNNVRKKKNPKRRDPPAQDSWAVLQWLTSPRNVPEHSKHDMWSPRPRSAGYHNRITSAKLQQHSFKVGNSALITQRQILKVNKLDELRHVKADLGSQSNLSNKYEEESESEKLGETRCRLTEPSVQLYHAERGRKTEKTKDSAFPKNLPLPNFQRRASLKYSDRQMTIFRLGDTDPTPLPATDPGEYSKSYRKWKEDRQNMTDGNLQGVFDADEPHTYEEWLDHKELISRRPTSRRKSEVAESILTNRNKISFSLEKSDKRQKSARRVTWKQ